MTQIIIVCIYLGVLVGLGLLSARFFRGTSADYFVASRSIGPVLLLMSVFGTTMTAFAMVGSTAQAYQYGFAAYAKVASYSALIHSACFFLIGIKLWAFGKRYGYQTQIEFFRDRFESSAVGYILFPVLIGLIIPYLLVGLLGAGSTLGGVTRGALPDLFPETGGAVPAWLSMGVISAVVLTYVFGGGVRSAAWANTFQTIVFMVMALLAFIVIAWSQGGMAEASSRIADKNLIRGGEINGQEVWNVGYLEFFTYGFIPLSVAMFPHLFQHWLTAKSAKTFRLTLVAHPIFIMITWIPCILIGMWATGALMPDGSPVIPNELKGSQANAVLGIMLAKLTDPVIAGLVTAGVLAAIMSSLDSQFVCMGTMFTRDIVVKSCGEDRFTDGQLVWISRGFIVFIVVVTYCIALLDPKQVFSLGVWCFSGFGALFPIIVAALYWRRTTAFGVILGIILTAVSWLILFIGFASPSGQPDPIYGLQPAFFMFLACLIGVVAGSLATRPPSEKTIAKFFKS